MNKMQLKRDLKEKRELINITLDRFLPRKDEYPKEIHKAVRHTLFAGGKRLRPYLVFSTFHLFSDEIEKVRPIGAAIEMLHTYTLIHDDLPEIDNDEYRRGKKSCHAVYGADLALLAGDALLAAAFEIISIAELSEDARLRMIRELGEECGANGLIIGQMMDILSEKKDIDKEQLKFIHDNKTGRLIRLAVRFGCYAAEAAEEDVTRLDEFGEKLGLAFQIVDDILDIEGSSSKMGKSTGKDQQTKKATYPAVYGIEKSRDMARKLARDCGKLLDAYGERANMLQQLTDFVVQRDF
jgi:geranylgeranyl diphosphate synthase, type II